MSDFSDKFTTQAVVKFLDRLGSSITYTPMGGTGVARTAVFLVLDDTTEVRRGIFMMASAAATGVASPERGDKITFGSDIWEVVEVRSGGEGSHELLAVLPQLNT